MNSTYNPAPPPKKNTLRISVLLVTLLGIFNSNQLSAQTLKMQFTFGDTGTTTADSVAGVVLNMVTNSVATDLHGAAGSGPGGQGKCLNLTGGAYNNAISPVAYTTGNSTINFGAVSNFTVSFWLKPRADSPLSTSSFFSRFFILGTNGTTDDNAANSIALQNGSTSPISVNHFVNTSGNSALYVTNPPTLMVTNGWTFLAMTFDGTNVNIYAGSETNFLSYQASSTLSSGQTVNLGSSFSLFLGNRGAATRVFQGSMADVRFYTGAASSNYLEAVREAAIPPVVKAATVTDLTANSSWTSGAIPRSTDTAYWTNTSLGAGLTLGSATTWGNMRVSGALTDIGITGAGPLTLANGIDMSASTVNMSLATPVTLGASQTWNVNSGDTLTASGVISGSGFGLTKSSSGTLILSGANTYTGITTVNAGTLHVTSPGVLYSTLAGNLANAVTVNTGGVVEFDTWDYGSANSFGTLNGTAGNVLVNGGRLRYIGSGTISGSRSLTIGAAGATLESANANANWGIITAFGVNVASSSGGLLTLTGAGNGSLAQIISGTGGLTMSGTGTWTLSSSNTYSGTTTISAGTLNLNVPETAGMSGPLGNQLANAAGTIVLSGGTLQYSATNHNDYSGRFSTANNQVYNVDVNGQLVGFNTALTSSGGSLALKDTAGGGKLTLAGANTYTGSSSINSGTLNLGVAEIVGTSGPLGRSSAANSGSIMLGGGTLQYSAANQNDYSGRFSTANNQTYNIDINGQSVSFGTALNSSGGSLTVKDTAGSGKLTLVATNTYTGITAINGSTLSVVSPGVIYGNLSGNLANAVTITNGGTIEFDTWDYGAGNSFGTLNGTAGNVFVNGGRLRYVGSGAISGSRSFTIGTAGATLESANANANWGIITSFGVNVVNTSGGLLTLTGLGNGNFGQIISGTGGLIKSGNGIWALSSTNTYSGTNYINGGTLLVNSDSSAVSNLWTVANGATLGGSGIIGGNVSFAPGALTTNTVGSPLTINGSLTLNNNIINVATVSALSRGNYLLLTDVASSISGSFSSVKVSGAGLTANTTSNLVQTANAIYLAVNSTPTVTVNVGSYTYNGTGNGPNTATISLTPDSGAVTWSYIGTGSTTYGPSANVPTNAGNYTATATVAADSANNLNAASSSAALFTINTQAASVTADAKNKNYGDVNPVLTAVMNGTVNGDVLNYTLATDATQYSAVGVSNIFVTLGSNPNYNVSATNGMLTISQANTFVGASSSENPSGYKDAISFTTTLPADATGSVVFSSTNGPISTNSVSGGIATSLSITNVPRGTNVITVAYLGDSNYLGSATNLDQIVTNHPPTAVVMTVTRTAGLALIISLSDIATNWNDVDGDTVEVTSVTMQSTNGINLLPLNWSTNMDGSIVTTNGYAYIGYTNSPNVNDQISYGISDGFGGTNIGYVNIVIRGSVTGTNSITAYNFTSPNSNTVTAYGIPYFYYILERSTNLSSPVWVNVQTNQAAPNGLINLTDQFIDLSGNKPSPAFYQLKWQP